MAQIVISKKKSPCFGCGDRVLGCHSSCEKYQDFRRQADAAIREKMKWIDLNNHKWSRRR